jgi:hypothetical protein
VQRNIQLQGRLQLSQQLARHMSLEERLGIVVNGVSATLPAAQAASLWLYDLTGKQLQEWRGRYDGTRGWAKLASRGCHTLHNRGADGSGHEPPGRDFCR